MTTAALTDAEKTARIKTVVYAAGEALRQRHPWLRHQDAIGAGIMAFSLLGMITAGVLYYQGAIPWWICTPVIALFASFIHELEHDLIHLMYFRKSPRINSLMLILGWIARPSTINPLVRRRLHMHHHKHSGTATDIEERGITNGVPWGLKRFIMLGDNMLAVYLRPIETLKMSRAFVRAQKVTSDAERKALAWELRTSYFPLANLYYPVWHGLIAWHLFALLASAFGHTPTLPDWGVQTLSVLNFMAVVMFLPSLLRTYCLHFVSSSMHYYGDVEDQNVVQQTQVLNAWWMLPFQLFCFNFGSTHAIHHFVVKEPFYVRQWTAKQAHAVMREMGVRFNDIGSFRRANRWHSTPVQA